MSRSSINCTSLKALKISHPACLSIVASACEVYPKECLGTLCCKRIPKFKGKVVAAFPFQLANRKPYGVESNSYSFFSNMLLKGGPWSTLGSFHSHTCYDEKYNFLCSPSKIDLESMEIGDLEIIIRVMRKRKRNINIWESTSGGNISVSWGKFQFLIRGFVRTEGYDSNGIPFYKNVKLELN